MGNGSLYNKSIEETRYVGIVMPRNNTSRFLESDSIYLPVDFSALTKIQIIFNPWVDEDIKNCVVHELEEYKSDFPIEHIDSKFRNKIHRER